MQNTLKNSVDIFAECGVKPSHQRITVFENLRKRTDHPTAEMVYLSLSPSMPTLSRTTVYNTLKLFCDKGIAIIVSSDQNEMRFDAGTHFHPHFKCKGCGGIFDLDIKRDCKEKFLSELLHNGYQIDSMQILLSGFCPRCRKSEKKCLH